MADNSTQADRPVPGPPVIGVEGEVEILRELLDIERRRLTMAHKMEADRKIIFPETTVIVRDIERLLDKIRAKETNGAALSTSPPDDDDPLDAILRNVETL